MKAFVSIESKYTSKGHYKALFLGQFSSHLSAARDKKRRRYLTTRFASSLESTEVTEKERNLFAFFSVTSVLSSELAKRVVNASFFLHQPHSAAYEKLSFLLRKSAAGMKNLRVNLVLAVSCCVMMASPPLCAAKKSHHLIHSDLYQVPGYPLKKGGIGFINGIQTPLETAHAYALKISRYAQGAKVSYVHNAPHSVFVDLSECLLGYLSATTPPVLLLLQQWEDFVRTQEEGTKFLQIAHSQGALHVRNALQLAREDVRSRIIVLAIAPAAMIPASLCFRSYNYVSKNDLIPYFDVQGNDLHADEILLLEPHAESEDLDHAFESPTYQEVLHHTIQEFLRDLEGS